MLSCHTWQRCVQRYGLLRPRAEGVEHMIDCQRPGAGVRGPYICKGSNRKRRRSKQFCSRTLHHREGNCRPQGFVLEVCPIARCASTRNPFVKKHSVYPKPCVRLSASISDRAEFRLAMRAGSSSAWSMVFSRMARCPPIRPSVAGTMHSTRSFQRLVRTIKAAWHAECDDKGGQVLTVDMGGCLVSACWRRPDRNEAAANFWSHVTETTQNAQARCIPWIGLGDWNHTPDEMWMCATGYAFDCAVKARDDSFQPSRWNGRCVDFAVSTHAGLLSTPMYWTDVLSDHKVYGVNLTIRCEEASNFYMAPTRSYLKPEGVSADVWRKTISRHWMQTSPIPATTTEEEWYSFNAAVEECLCSAATDHGCRRTERRRPKGTAPWTVCATDYTCRAANLSTFPAGSTRKLLGRIREYRRQILLEKEDPALLRHIRRTWPECHRFSSRFQAEQHLQQQLDMMRASLKRPTCNSGGPA